MLIDSLLQRVLCLEGVLRAQMEFHQSTRMQLVQVVVGLGVVGLVVVGLGVGDLVVVDSAEADVVVGREGLAEAVANNTLVL